MVVCLVPLPSSPVKIRSCYTPESTLKTAKSKTCVPKDLSDPYLREWVKHVGNPVISLPEEIHPGDFRDPTTAWLAEDGKWRLIVGSQKEKTGIAFLYYSDDFVNWTKSDSPLHEVSGTGMWECPDFFPVWIDSMDGVDTSVVNPSDRVKHVLKLGIQDHGKDCYLIGKYSPDTEEYVPEDEFTHSTLRLDYGIYFASKSFFDPVKKRRIMMAWVNECDSEADVIAKGWSGVQSFPRSIWLHKDQKHLIQWPIEEIEMLHENKVSFRNKKLEGGSIHEIQGITASQADVKISFKLASLEEAEELDLSLVDPQLICTEYDASKKGKLGPFGILALASNDLIEQTAIFFRVFRKNGRFVVLMCSDQSRSSTRSGIDKTTYGAFVDIDPQQDEISLRTLIDHSIVESFGGGGKTCITARVYPTLAIGEEARLFAFNYGTEGVVISELSAWSLKKAQMNVEEP